MPQVRNATTTSKPVSASALGQYVFCPESWRLTANGARPNQIASQRMQAGVTAHEQWQRHEDTAHDKGSAITRVAMVVIALLTLLAFVWVLLGVGW